MEKHPTTFIASAMRRNNNPLESKFNMFTNGLTSTVNKGEKSNNNKVCLPI